MGEAALLLTFVIICRCGSWSDLEAPFCVVKSGEMGLIIHMTETRFVTRSEAGLMTSGL